MKKWLIPVIVVVVIAVAVGGFFGGRATASSGNPTLEQAMARMQSATPQEMQQALQGAGRNGASGGPGFVFGGNGTRANGGGAVAGTIVSADSSSITVKSENGSTKIVLVSGSTTIAKTQPGTMADLTTGQTVIVTGTSNSDGTITATRVQAGAALPSVQGGTGQGAAATPGQ